MFADDAGICSEKRKQMEDSMGKCYGENMKAEVRQCWQGGVGGASVRVDLLREGLHYARETL